MNQRSLLILGLLKAQSQHGYQINEFIESNLTCLVAMKRATAYATLERLHKSGNVSIDIEQVGNRPPRKVYSITAKGETTFLDLLWDELADPDPHSSAGDIGLMFIHYVPQKQAARLLNKRLTRLDEMITVLEGTPEHGMAPGVDLAVNRSIALLQADRIWLTRLIDELLAGKPLGKQIQERK